MIGSADQEWATKLAINIRLDSSVFDHGGKIRENAKLQNFLLKAGGGVGVGVGVRASQFLLTIVCQLKINPGTRNPEMFLQTMDLSQKGNCIEMLISYIWDSVVHVPLQTIQKEKSILKFLFEISQNLIIKEQFQQYCRNWYSFSYQIFHKSYPYRHEMYWL